MCSLFIGLRGAGRVLALGKGVMIQPRAGYIHSKPAKDPIGAAESVFVLTVLSAAVLGPSGWILAHLDHYQTRR